MNANSSTDSIIQPRPMIVTILAIFTIVGTVLYLGFLLIKPLIPEIGAQEVDLPTWMDVSNVGLSLGKLVAVLLLMRMRRIGFFLYTILEVVAATVTIIGSKLTMDFMDSSFVNPDIDFDPKILVLAMLGMSIGLSIIFIGGFASQLSKMT